jgi:hypothetical protein
MTIWYFWAGALFFGNGMDGLVAAVLASGGDRSRSVVGEGVFRRSGVRRELFGAASSGASSEAHANSDAHPVADLPASDLSSGATIANLGSNFLE